MLAAFCSTCGAKFSDAGAFCAVCGSSKVVGADAAATAATERVFLENKNGVTVTSARLITPNGTYALANVSSIRTVTKQPTRGCAIFALVFFGFCTLSAMVRDVTASVFIFGTLTVISACFMVGKPEYIVTLHASGGESDALITRDGAFAKLVVESVNTAIVARG